MYDNLDIFIRRLKLIGIELELTSNSPWIYITKINNKVVTEKFQSEHGFVIGYHPIKINDTFKFSDTAEIFKLLKKYK